MREWTKTGLWFVGCFLTFLVAGSMLIAGCGWRESNAAAQTFDPIELPTWVDLTPQDGIRPPRVMPPLTPTVADVGWSCADQTAWVTIEGTTRQLTRLSPGVFQLGSVNDSAGHATTLSLHGAVTNGLGDLVVTCIAEPLVIERAPVKVVAPSTTLGFCG